MSADTQPSVPKSEDDLLNSAFAGFEEPVPSAPEPTESAPPPQEQPRDEQGRYVEKSGEVPGAAAPEGAKPQTPPAETPAQRERRLIKFKVDHEEQELDWNAIPDAEAAELARKGRAFDKVLPRERERGQSETLAWFKAQGYDVVQDPTTRQYKVVHPQQASQPAAAEQPKSPPSDTADLKRRAREGDAEAIAELIDLAESRASQAQTALEQWRAQQEAERQKQTEYERNLAFANEVAAKVNPPLEQFVKEFGDTPQVQGVVKRLRQFAAASALSGVAPDEIAASLGETVANFRALRGPVAPASAAPAPTQARPAAPPPPPYIPTPGGSTTRSGTTTKPKNADELLEQSFRWDG